MPFWRLLGYFFGWFVIIWFGFIEGLNLNWFILTIRNSEDVFSRFGRYFFLSLSIVMFLFFGLILFSLFFDSIFDNFSVIFWDDFDSFDQVLSKICISIWFGVFWLFILTIWNFKNLFSRFGRYFYICSFSNGFYFVFSFDSIFGNF
jgi:hypothetical protein